MGRFDRHYARLPVWAQHTAISVFGLYWHWVRFGPGAASYVAGYEARERFTREEWANYRQKRLTDLLSATAAHVPFYRETWNAHERKAAAEGRLEALPLLDKKDVRDNAHSFVRDDMHPRSPLILNTSGSTGTPIKNFWTIPEYRESRCLREARSARWAGVSFKQPRATFHGRMVEPNPDSQGPFYRFNVVEKQVYLSAFHLRPETAAKYVEALNRHQVRWMTGYAISFYMLAQFMLELRLLPPPALQAVITTSEKLTSKMRQTMQEAFGCRVYEEYSTVENALFASECESGGLHSSPDVAVVEILRPDGSACAAGEVGEVVTTCLMREYQPFIRYRLGDLAAWDDAACSCGRAMPVLKEVVGRTEDFVIGINGQRVVQFYGVFRDQPHVREGQIIQERLGAVRVKVVPTSDFSASDTQDIIERMRQRLGAEMQVEVESVRHIPRTAAGKFRAVISRLNPTDKAGAPHR